ncbi:hypothetical protein [Streptomyces sp. SID1034]|uniref:hypothetical protein n=1 Tax=Streptomyces sp. SID1034 TaxID=2690248 RepID=UPI00136E7E18|nr:hypothetical protein [Streptomyces sp. SID1034]MYV92987.1 hypothetical protein [Streptomyces sp. SID1034]
MTTLLEQRYRTVLRLLPASYRAEREEEMVETYLESVPEELHDLVRPAWGEVTSIAGLALRTRLDGTPTLPRTGLRLGPLFRQFALFGVLLNAASALSGHALFLAWLGGAPAPDQERVASSFRGSGIWDSFPVQVALWVAPLAWAGAYVALVRDRRRAALVFAALAALPALAGAARQLTWMPGGVATYALATAAAALLTVAALACGYHADAPPTPLPPVPPGLALMGLSVVAGAADVLHPGAIDALWPGGIPFLAVGALALAGRARASAGGPAVPLALAALGALALAERGFLLGELGRYQVPGPLITDALVLTGALAVLVALLLATGARALFRDRAPSRAGG